MKRMRNLLGGLLSLVVVGVFLVVLVLFFRGQAGGPVALAPVRQATPPSVDVPRVTDLRMSDRPGGPAMTAFPLNTRALHVMFDYAGLEDTPVMVRVYDGVGNVLFEAQERYSGTGSRVLAVVSPKGVFREDFYLTNIYYGPDLSLAQSVEWVVGQPPTPVPAPTETPWPTEIPPTPWPQPTVTPLPPLPTPEPTLPGPLAPGLKIVYAETDSSIREYATPEALRDHGTTFWIADVNNVSNRRLIARVQHRGFSPIRAQLSPDGRKIAYVIEPVGSVGAKHTGELWVMAVDGTDQMLLDTEVTMLVKPYPLWSPDSTQIVYFRYTPKDMEYLGVSELYAAAADGNGIQHLLTSEDSLSPIGWSSTGELLYTRTGVGVEGGIWKLDLTTGHTEQLISLELGAGRPVVSPDGSLVVYSVPKGGPGPNTEFDLVIASLDRQRKETISRAGPSISPDPRSYFEAIWAPDSKKITAHLPAEATERYPELQIFDLSTHLWRAQPAVTEPSAEEFDLPRGWSPDGQWLLVEHRPTLDYYLVTRDGRRIQAVAPERHVQLVGWVD